ncbi:MAG TPA: RNA polymerase sigma factor, partial [Ktedonobacterales bacterium]
MEADVVNRLVTDLARGFECLVREQQHHVYAFAWSLTGNPQDAEDVSQEAFIRAWRALCGYDRERIRALRPRPWLFAIAHNVWRNRVRGKRLPTGPLDEAAWAIPAPHEAEPATQVEAAERTEMLTR